MGNNLRVELLEDWDKAARDTGLGNMEDGIMCYASCCSNMGVEKRINGVRSGFVGGAGLAFSLGLSEDIYPNTWYDNLCAS